MTPYEQTCALYRPSNLDFQEDLDYHSEYGGYVFLSPQVNAMVRPVRKDWTPERIADARQVEPLETADCWFVWLLCGSLKEAVKHLPYRLPWVGFAQRGQPARFIELEKALAKIG